MTLILTLRKHGESEGRGWTQQQYRVELEKLISQTRQELKAGEIHLNKHTREYHGLPTLGDQ